MLRSTILALTVIGTAIATWILADRFFAAGSLPAAGRWPNPFYVAATILFVPLFGWILFSLLLCLTGFFRWLLNRSQSTTHLSATGPAARTAILMPVYNESPTTVFAAISAMADAIEEAGWGEAFDIFVLSDSTDSEVWLREEWCWSRLQRLRAAQQEVATDPARQDNQLSGGQLAGSPAAGTLNDRRVQVYYRHRTKNVARKAGNIEDFCELWGTRYDYMLVLDADSLMTADTIVEMVRRMESDDQLAILQVPPVPIGRGSLFSRIQQFSASVYGPVFGHGLAAWAGDQGNYWGHNAIIRVAAFMEHCKLPVLPGRPPFGGEILSHDFVEAALLVAGGWKVHLANDLGGSYEECPTTIADYAIRDQRWCQGNLQHWGVMTARGIHPISRMHFATGIFAYVSSPVWLAFLACTIAGMIWQRLLVGQPPAAATGLDSPARMALLLFAVSMAMLLVPKVLATAMTLIDRNRRRSHGGAASILGGVVVETVLAVLIAPLVAVFHSRFVIAAIRGTNVRWNAQQRDERGVSWSEAARQFAGLTVFGVLVAVLLGWLDPVILAWFSPIVVGWILSIPIAVAMGSAAVGRAFRRWGLLVIPSERREEPIVGRQRRWISTFESEPAISGESSMFEMLWRDPKFRQQHLMILQASENESPIGDEHVEVLKTAESQKTWTAVPKETRRGLLSDEAWIRRLAAAFE